MEGYVGTTRDPFLHSLLPRGKRPQLAISLLQALGHRVREWKSNGKQMEHFKTGAYRGVIYRIWVPMVHDLLVVCSLGKKGDDKATCQMVRI